MLIIISSLKKINIQETIELDRDKSLHVASARRKEVGDELLVGNGQGEVWKAEITSIDKRNTVRLGNFELKSINTKGVNTTVKLFQCLPKHQNIELIIQKTTELGIHEITPIQSEFTIAKIKNEDVYGRWNRIAIEACEQSYRYILPEIKLFKPIEKSLSELTNSPLDMAFYLSPTGNLSLKNFLQKAAQPKSIAFFIGPEGGFSELDKELFAKYNITPVSYGESILRTETAALSVMAAIRYEYF